MGLVSCLPMQETSDAGSISGSRRFPAEANGYPLQYSCLENPVERGAWKATVHSVTKSQTWLKWLSMHIHAQCSWPHFWVGKWVQSVGMRMNVELALQGREEGEVNGKTNLPKKVREVLVIVINAMEFGATMDRMTRHTLVYFLEVFFYLLDFVKSLNQLL